MEDLDFEALALIEIDAAAREEGDFPSEVACPGCGCEPGEGLTEGCAHPLGCGFALEILAGA